MTYNMTITLTVMEVEQQTAAWGRALWLSVKLAKLLLNQALVQPPLLPSGVIDSSADSAVSSPLGETPCGALGFYDQCAHFNFLWLCGIMTFSHPRRWTKSIKMLVVTGTGTTAAQTCVNISTNPTNYAQNTKLNVQRRRNAVLLLVLATTSCCAFYLLQSESEEHLFEM